MKINYNGRQFLIPSSLHSITLEQWIKWKETYSKGLEDQQKEIELMPDSSDKDVEAFLLLSDTSCKFFSFYTGIDLEEVRTNFDVNQLINVYTSSSKIVASEQMMLEVESEYLFDNAIWKIVPPAEMIRKDGLLYESFLEIKKMFVDLSAFSEGVWNRLPSLCAIYFRKENETIFDIIKCLEDRKVLMLQLPLDIGLTIAKYLDVTLKTFVDILNADSVQTELK